MEIPVLYEDKDIIVCSKRAGIAVQSARVGQKDMVSILMNYLTDTKRQNQTAEKGQDGSEPVVYVVHRLDQPVEGLLVFGKNKKAAAGLTRQITQGSVGKIYEAVCCLVTEGGQNAVQNGDLCPWEKGKSYNLMDYLIRDGRTNASRVGKKGERDAKKSELSFEITQQKILGKNGYVRVRINLGTGRHHQIRVQMAHAGLPLYGDQKYNSCWEEYILEPGEKVSLALCAAELHFHHPVSGKRMEFRVNPENPVFHKIS